MCPRGVLVYRGGTIEWHPDRYEVRHGDQPYVWSTGDVTCVERRRRLDISGIRYVKAKLRLPEGVVTLGIFNERGTRPQFLA